MRRVRRESSVRPFAGIAAFAGAGAAVLALAGPANALTIIPVFTSSVTKLSNAKTIEASFDDAVKILETKLKAPVTVKVDVDWGNLDGRALSSGDISESLSSVYDGYSYAEIKTYLKTAALTNPRDTTLVAAAASLPANDPISLNNFYVTSADAKALGLLPPTMPNLDGYVGFSSSGKYDFGSAPVAGEYDFESLALHELSEVLGRSSGLTSSRPTQATIMDLLRYARSGVHSFSYSASSYLSINGGRSSLGAFNYSGGYDRGDWASSVADDIQDAVASSGRLTEISSADLALLDALGWDTITNPGGWIASPSMISGAAGISVPEPATWTMAILGASLMGAALRRRRMRVQPV